MKKLLSGILCVVISVAIWGCSNPGKKPAQNQNPRPTVVGFYDALLDQTTQDKAMAALIDEGEANNWENK